MKYKMFISDYDGTLGKAPENNVDKETLEAINKYIVKGGIFVICSGRETSSITRICKENGLKGLIASFQGARISDIETGEYLFDGGIDSQTAVKVLDDVGSEGLVPVAYLGDKFFYEKHNQFVEAYRNAIRLEGFEVNVKEKILKENIRTSKICWLGEESLVNQTAERMNKKYGGKEVVFNSGAKFLLEAINPEHGKGKAVKFLANYYGISLDEIIAVGDSTNDMELIKGEWHGVAVGDGKKELKAVADEITVPFKDKPVKTLLEKYCL